MAEEVSCVRSLDAGCPSPSSLSPGSCTKSCDVTGYVILDDMSGFCLASQTQMLRCKVQDLLSCVQALGSGITSSPPR